MDRTLGALSIKKFLGGVVLLLGLLYTPETSHAFVSGVGKDVTVSTGSLTVFQGGLWEVSSATTIVTGSTVAVVNASSPLEVIQSSRTFSLNNVSVTVSGGSGSAVFSATGTIRQCAFVPPSTPATYDIEVETGDVDAFFLFGRKNMRDKSTLYIPRILIGAYSLNIDNATVDGIYKMRCPLLK